MDQISECPKKKKSPSQRQQHSRRPVKEPKEGAPPQKRPVLVPFPWPNKDMGIKGEGEDRRKDKQTTDDGKGKNGHQNHRGHRKQG
jgi:hypothetical protein